MILTYGKASLDDADRIYKLSKSLIDEYEDVEAIEYDKVLRWVRNKIIGSIGEYTAVFADGVKAGYYHFFLNGDGEYELDDLYIFSEFQNLGIGTEIIRRCCASVANPVMLYVFIKNKRAVSLYKRLGFEVAETVGNSRYIMKRRGNA